MVESEESTGPDPELSPNNGELTSKTESDQDELEEEDAAVYVLFYSSEHTHTVCASETMAQIEHLMLNILEQITASLQKSRRDLGSVVPTQSHRHSDGKVEIQIADRRKDKPGG